MKFNAVFILGMTITYFLAIMVKINKYLGSNIIIQLIWSEYRLSSGRSGRYLNKFYHCSYICI